MALREPLGDLYEELGVARDASRDEITAAYRARAKELHPDARPDDATAAERFAGSAPPTGCLADPEERARYDASRRTTSGADAGQAPPRAISVRLIRWWRRR